MDWLSLNNIARELVAEMADASVRAVFLASLVLFLIAFLRRRSTAQHMAWTLVLAGMLLLPFLRPVVPATYVHLPPVLTPGPTKIAPPVRSSANASAVSAPISRSRTKTSLPAPPLWPLYLVTVYLAGLLVFGGRLAGGVLLTRRALRNTRTVQSELWQYYDLIADANVDLSLEESGSVRTSLTTGLRLMRVILPADWREWPREKLTAVIAHELAHARRRDPLTALVAAINKCLFWFHPLAWWLARRLPVLAEHAADDAALAVVSDIDSYARLLLDGATRLGNSHRLIWHSTGIGGPLVARRIRRVLDVHTVTRLKPFGKIGRAMLLSAGALLILISTSVDVPGLIAGQANHSQSFVGLRGMTAEEAATLEQVLAANQEDEATRGKLLSYYMFTAMRCARGGDKGPVCSDNDGKQASGRRVSLILWLIDHHPDSGLFEYPGTSIVQGIDGPNAYEEARTHWLAQVNMHPSDAQVLLNAARSMSLMFAIDRNVRVREKIDLLKRVQTLAPGRGTELLSNIYASVLRFSQPEVTKTKQWELYYSRLQSYDDPALAGQIETELQSSNDAALLGSIGQHLYASAEATDFGTTDIGELRTLATTLVTRAHALDPQNREWSVLMESLEGLPVGSLAPLARTTSAPASSAPVQTIHLGGAIQAQNLLESSAPIYPPLAQAAGVQGTVKLQLRVGADGHVKDITVISGHPLLIQAAMDAAKRYAYKPTMLNGQAADVLTDVEILFRSTQP
jgi:TonB family protein